jgi:hypothetical protein
MPQSLGPIPAGVVIVDDDGAITDFLRLRWQQLIDGFQQTPSVASVLAVGQTADIATTAAFTTRTTGTYRVNYYLRKTVADGVSSSLTFTWGWTEDGVPLTSTAAALTLDTTGATQSGSLVVDADAATDLTFAVSYASNTPARMTYRIRVTTEFLP